MRINRLFLTIILIIILINPIAARNYIKIATIGTTQPHLDKTRGYQFMVDEMIDFWQDQLEQVLPDKPDLIVLPEVCDRPQGMDLEDLMAYYAVRGKQVWDYFASVAKENQCYIAFGTKHQIEDGTWRNSCVILDRAGQKAGIYHKNFPTIGEMESGIIAGKDTPIIECDFGRVGAAICFDLNFEELRHRYAALKPDIIIFPSMYHGGLVQGIWAYECRAYFVGSFGNRTVPCEIRNPMGDVIATSTNYFNFVVKTINLDYCLVHLDYNWERLTALKEKYGDAVTIYDPSKIGSVLITSEHESITSKQMVKEFEIELLDDYFERSRNFRTKPGMME